MKRFFALLLALIYSALLAGCGSTNTQAEKKERKNTNETVTASESDAESNQTAADFTITRNGYSVSTSSEEATMAGAAVLENGGNAVDAAIAVSYVLGVTESYASGIGGGGGMLIYEPDTETFTFLNYESSAAPSGARENNIGLPGFADGMQTAYDLYGSVDFSELLSYAIDYAENGIVVSSELANRIANAAGYLPHSAPHYGLSEGDTLIQTDLAETLRLLAAEGSDAFYSGDIARDICNATSLTEADLASAETEITEPVTTTVAGCTVVSAPAPFSGLTVLQMLRLMELTDVPSPSEDNAGYLKSLISVKMSTGAVRADNICDLTYNGTFLDYDELLSDSYLSELLGVPPEEYEEDNESEDTTHLSIVDTNGMAVSATNTLSHFWGSYVYVDGFYLNNTLSCFSSGVNAYAAGKRPRTFISPTIVLGEDGSVTAAGTPGGNVICNVMATVLADILLYDEEPQEAVNKQRIVVQNSNTLLIETGLDYDPVADASGLGYYLVRSNQNRKFGSVNIAGYDPENGWFATTDVRRMGYGYAWNEGR